jgi:hypothetical protein
VVYPQEGTYQAMTLEERLKEHVQIRAGLHVAIAEAIEEHRRAGREVAIWRNGKVLRVTVEEAKDPDRPAG